MEKSYSYSYSGLKLSFLILKLEEPILFSLLFQDLSDSTISEICIGYCLITWEFIEDNFFLIIGLF